MQDGLVVASHGRHVWVETPAGERVLCHPRGKKNQTVVGDRVLWQTTGDEGSIEQVQERRSLLYRQDDIRSKFFAANIDQVLVLIAAEPEFSEHQLARALIAAEEAGIGVLIALNKQDLAEPFARAWARLQPYRDMGYTVLPLALNPETANTNTTVTPSPAEQLAQLLQQHLQGKATLVLGPSGSGKSTLINGLVPGALAATNTISTALNTGKHTTTSTSWYWVDGVAPRSTAVIDSPGFQEFGLHHIEPTRLAHCMPDLRAHLGGCRFYNCTHLHEPGCSVRAAVPELLDDQSAARAQGISWRRYQIYSDLFAELSQEPRY
nr:ribosome small subunit-dependent GTPase A [Curvibacter sp. CHRR-16]